MKIFILICRYYVPALYMNFNKALLSLLLVFACTARSEAQFYPHWGDKREIATDYNTCLQGVKDSTGQWVIQPQYEYLEHYDSSYVVHAGGKSGLVDYGGKVMIPLMYDFLMPCDGWLDEGLHNYFIPMMNGRYGVVDRFNNLVVPIRYLDIESHYDSSFVARKTKRSYDFYNARGMRFDCPWKSKLQPVHEAEHLFTMRRRLFGEKYGLVNDSGRVILPREYEQIDVYGRTGTIRVHRKDKYGFCSTAGAEIWPIVFSERDWKNNDDFDYSQLVGSKGAGPVKLNGKYGLISAKGDTILPFIYKRIVPFDYETPELWSVGVDSLLGIYNSNSGWLLNPACTYINSIASYRNEKDSAALALLVAKMNGKWGAMTTSGQIVIPFECDYVLFPNTGQQVFLKGDSVFALTVTSVYERYEFSKRINRSGGPEIFIYEFLQQQANSAAPASNRFSVFKGKDGVRTFYHPGLTKDSIEIDSGVVSTPTGNYYGMKVPDSIFIASCFSVIPMLKPVKDFEQFDFYDVPQLSDTDSSSQDLSVCLMHGKKRDRLTSLINYAPPFYITSDYDVLKSNGTIVISGDTIHYAEKGYHRHDGSLYFTIRDRFSGSTFAVDTNGKIAHPKSYRDIEEFNGNYTWYGTYDQKYKNFCYELVDNRNGQSLLGEKQYSEDVYPIWDSITIVASHTRGMRIFNITQRRYCTEYGYEEIIPLRNDGTLFAVKTCSHNIGVVDAEGYTVLDTIYTALTCVDQLMNLMGNGSFRSEYFGTFYTAMVFYNEKQSVMLDLVNKKIIPHNEAVPIVWNNLVTTHYTSPQYRAPLDTVYSFFSGDKLISICMPARDSAQMRPWQKQCIFDSIFTAQRQQRIFYNSYFRRCYYCEKKGGASTLGHWTNYPSRTVRYLLGYQDDSLLCFARVGNGYVAYPLTDKSTLSTVMLFSDGPHQMTLDSLFNPASDWRNFIINTLISYVNNHQNITGDCHNPAGIPAMLNETFELTPAGLYLYPHGFEEDGEQLILLVPWKDLDAYLRNDLRSRLPIAQQ